MMKYQNQRRLARRAQERLIIEAKRSDWPLPMDGFSAADDAMLRATRRALRHSACAGAATWQIQSHQDSGSCPPSRITLCVYK